MPTSMSSSSSLKRADSLFIIIFENNSFDNVVAKSFFRELTKCGTLLTNSHGIEPPSQMNYIALTGGSTFPDFIDPPTNANVNLPFTNVYDLLDQKHISWKVYQEGYPGQCFADAGNPCIPETKFSNECADNPWYVRKHNPAISYDNVRNNPAR